MVTVFGLGFVGLTSALWFAETGHKVYGVESDTERLKTIQGGRVPFAEPGLGEALSRHLNKNFFPVEDAQAAIGDSDYVFYCVGTPYGKNGQADLTQLFTAIEQTLAAINDDRFRVLVTKSTIPPSTTMQKVIPFIKDQGWEVGRQLGVANNPEFLREGHCWQDVMNADRIVLGVGDERTEELLRRLYKDSPALVFCVSYNTGEFIKYLSNTLLATLISYSNEMSIIAEAVDGVDIKQAFRVLHKDKRWNGCDMASYAYPGCGYGGYCLPKDVKALYSYSNSIGFEPGILKSVIETNERMAGFIAEKICRYLSKDQSLGILGLSFKPNSDDVRDAPSAKIIALLQEEGYCNIYGYDPVANDEFKQYYPGLRVKYCKSLEEITAIADVLAVMTAWPEFINASFSKTVIDCRYCM